MTNVPGQALILLNDPFVIDNARALAERVRREAPGDLRAQVGRAWRILFSATPSPADLDLALLHVAEQGEELRTRLQPEPVKEGQAPPAPPDPQLEALASYCQVLLASNRFLTFD